MRSKKGPTQSFCSFATTSTFAQICWSLKGFDSSSDGYLDQSLGFTGFHVDFENPMKRPAFADLFYKASFFVSRRKSGTSPDSPTLINFSKKGTSPSTLPYPNVFSNQSWWGWDQFTDRTTSRLVIHRVKWLPHHYWLVRPIGTCTFKGENHNVTGYLRLLPRMMSTPKKQYTRLQVTDGISHAVFQFRREEPFFKRTSYYLRS